MSIERFKEAMAQHTLLRSMVEDAETAADEATKHWIKVGQLPEYAVVLTVIVHDGLAIVRYQTGHHAMVMVDDVKRSVLFGPGE